MPFRFDSCYVFLTYPQSQFEHSSLHGFLNSVCTTEWCRIASELHESGDPHVHVVAQFVRRFQTRNERVFDYEGRHPNIQPVRNTAKALTYVSKDGQFTDFGTVPVKRPRTTEAEALSLATTPDEGEYLRACLSARIPFQYAKRIRELAMADGDSIIAEDHETQISWECARLQTQELPSGNKCAVVIGPSGCGKTTWACRVAPKPALWVRHIDVLRQFKAGVHKSIIFDDMSFTQWPVTSQIHLVDMYKKSQIHCRYGYATIPAGIPRIFTCNEDPFTICEMITRRTEYIRL